MPKCYMCDSDSTSVEHTPPKSFFPTDMRTNLITVPACKIHNEDTSKDDEYVRNILTMSIENNQTAVDHFFDKTLRSFQRSPGLAIAIRNSLTDVLFNDMAAKGFQIDRRRFDKVIRKISYALFYKEHGYSWERLLAVTTNLLRNADMTNDHLGEMFEDLAKDLNEFVVEASILKGENPLVFQYAFIDFDKGPHDKGLFLLFYEGFPFLIIPDKTSTYADFD